MVSVSTPVIAVMGIKIVLMAVMKVDVVSHSLVEWDTLIPRLSWNMNMYPVESLVSFLRKHDVIKIDKNRKAMFCALFNQLCFNARCV